MQSNEFIKKQTVYEILDRMKKIRDENLAGLISDAVSASIRCVENNVMFAHAEDVAPVRHGRWIKTVGENGITSAVRCSECSFEDNRYSLFNFCPNCGADMRET